MFCFLCVRGVDAAKLYSEPVQRLKLELWQLEEKARELENAGAPGSVGKQEVASGIETAGGMGKAGRQEADSGLKNVSETLGADSERKGVAAPGYEREEGGLGIADVAVSGQRVVDCYSMERRCVYELSDEEMDVLLRIVEAEAGNEDEDGKLLVANVVLNRVDSEEFPDTVKEVVFQKERGVTQFSPVSNGSYYRVRVSDETVSAVGRALMGEDISEGALYFAARKYVSDSKMAWFDENLTYLFVHGGHEFFK